MLILLKSGPYGPMYINPESIASVREIPVGMRENRGEVEITMISGLRDFITLEEWEHIKPGLMGESPSLNHEASPTDAYLRGRLHGYDKAFAEGADWQKTQPTTLTLTERVTLFTLLHAHLNADQPQHAREMIANSIADFAEGKQRDRYAHMGLMSVLKEFGPSAAEEVPSAEERAAFQKKVDAAFDEAENYFYPTGPDDTPHCKTCGADLLYCRCKHTDSL